MTPLTRITLDPDVMGGKPCIRGAHHGRDCCRPGRERPKHSEILAACPYLEEEDVREALAYAAWRVEETEVPIAK